ncbi:MAG: hypothetical protein ILO36_07595 [Abditibacteriota bacterium]|nr:hypothetical protein [Abditibacteriota bacterium]
MKKVFFIIMCLFAAALLRADEYDFDGSMPQKTLEAYLARAIGYNGICVLGQGFPEKFQKDSLRAVENMKPMYISRAALGWETPADAEKHFAAARKGAEEIHGIDSRIILEAAIFEAVYSVGDTDVNRIPVPAWVFEAFGLPAEERCFRYDDMLFPGGRCKDFWKQGVSVPDITRQETQMWQYYRACRYIDAGYEAINFGHIALLGAEDKNLEAWDRLLGMVRAYGRKRARRHYVLCTGHLQADLAKKDGRLLWDYAQFPLRLVTGTEPLKASLREGHADSTYNTYPGGEHPAGYQCAALPALYEFDNFFGGIDVNQPHMVWGTDETGWLGNLTPGYRNYFLKYAASWLRKNVVSAYLMMPGCRPTHVPVTTREQILYFCNDPSEKCPIGGGQEDTVKALFAQRFDLQPAPQIPAEKKRPKGEQLGFRPVENGIGERLFDKAESYTVPNYTNGYIKDAFDIYGVKGSGIKPEGFVPAPKAAKIGPEGLWLSGPTVEIKSFPEISGGALTVYMSLTLSESCFEESFALLEKFSFMKDGWHIRYYKPGDSFYAEIFDGSGERRLIEFPVPKDGSLHRICFTCDGKTLKGWLDGRECGSVPAGKTVPNTTNLKIGGGIDGLLTDIKIFNYALSRSDAESLTAGRLDAPEEEEDPLLEIFGEIRRGGRGFGIRIGF